MSDPSAQIQSALDRFVAGQSHPLRVLEAGCGSLSNIRLGSNVRIVGIDVSAEALAQNATIHEGIQANLETSDLGDSEYDLIVCWDVLEHLAKPTNVVRKFLRAVKPGGLILLALPNVLSLKGLVAKYTPLSFHFLVHRLIYGQRAGIAPGYEVCPTYLCYSIAPRSIARLATHHAFDVDLFSTYESGMQRRFRERFGLVGKPWQVVRVLVCLLSIGIIDAEATDCILILRRPRLSVRLQSPISQTGPHPEAVTNSVATSAASKQL
ncbi:MAG: class I SAM-dependent methyltransferase [Candidatus Rokubacteria bacterium]|nr:class I SAM-dependent methyltransferase [Candidatus Rokubacteria bacterium]